MASPSAAAAGLKAAATAGHADLVKDLLPEEFLGWVVLPHWERAKNMETVWNNRMLYISFLTASLPAPLQDITIVAFFACEAWHVHKPAHKIGSVFLTVPLKIQVGSHPRGQGRIDGSCNTWTFGCARPPGSCRRSGAGRSTDSTLPKAADPYWW